MHPEMARAGKVPFYTALLVAGLAFAVNLRYSGFVPIFTDPSGYVSAGARWLSGDVQKPVAFQFQPQFPNYENMGSPLAYRPGATPGTDVSEYPLGLPVFLAAAMAVGGELGATGPPAENLHMVCRATICRCRVRRAHQAPTLPRPVRSEPLPIACNRQFFTWPCAPRERSH
jgi:hypothetical protein